MTNIFTTVLEYGDFVISWVWGFFDNLSQIVLGLLMTIFYPLVMAANLIYSDVSYVYTTVVTTINTFISIPAVAQSFFTTYTPSNLPSAWTFLFLLMVSVQAYLSAMHLVRFIKSWIPTESG